MLGSATENLRVQIHKKKTRRKSSQQSVVGAKNFFLVDLFSELAGTLDACRSCGHTNKRTASAKFDVGAMNSCKYSTDRSDKGDDDVYESLLNTFSFGV